MFDKEKYWARRNNVSGTGKSRGQDGPNIRGGGKGGLAQLDQFGRFKEAEVGNKPVSKKALLKNTKRARKAAKA